MEKDWNYAMSLVEEVAKIKNWSINATMEYLSEDQDRDGLYSAEDVIEACNEFLKNK